MNWKPRDRRPSDHVFAWRPVTTVCGHRAWLEFVRRVETREVLQEPGPGLAVCRLLVGTGYALLRPNPAQRRQERWDREFWSDF